MQRPTGGPNRERDRFPTRAQQAAETRRTLRGVGWVGVGAGAVAFLAGAALGMDVIGHVPPQPTVAHGIWPQMSPDYQTNLSEILMGAGALVGVSGGSITYINQEPA